MIQPSERTVKGVSWSESRKTRMGSVEEVEQLKGEVWSKLRQVEIADLTEICGTLSIVIPPRKSGIKVALYNLIVRHLSDDAVEESDDGGL